MRTILVAFCLALVAAGCTGQGASGGKGAEPAGPGAPPSATSGDTTGTAPGGTSGDSSGGTPAPAPGGASGAGASAASPAPVPPASLIPVRAPIPDELRRVALPTGQPLENIGLYFMDVATGTLDAWLPPAGEYGMPSINLTASNDERWILAATQDVGHLIRRRDGAAFRYDPRQVQLTLGPGVILARPTQWQNGGAGLSCALLDENVKLLSSFSINGACTSNQRAFFAPDGKTLAFSDDNGLLSISLVTAATGAIKELGPFPAPAGHLLVSHWVSVMPGTGELVLHLGLIENGNYSKPSSIVRIYSWTGELRAEKRFPGTFASFSPDGKLVAYHENLGGRLGQALVIQEWGAAQPLFRVAGGLGTQWLADSSGLLVDTFRGEKLVSAAGAMEAAPGPSGKQFRPFDSLMPSPDDASRFLLLGTVMDQSGKTVQEAQAAGAKDLRITQAAWGPTAGSIHFTVLPNMGKGWDADFNFWLGPSVQRPPYPDQYPLRVDDAAGECLNLRSEANTGTRVLRCLPTGTRLAVPLQENGEPSVAYEGEWVWLQVGTEQDETGWVAINTRSVSYAQ